MKHSEQTRNMWNKSQENYLRENYGIIPIEQILQVLNLSEKAVRMKAHRMKLIHSRWWTQNEINYLKEHYNNSTSKKISAYLKRSIAGIEHKAEKFGLVQKNFFPTERYCIDCGVKLGNKYLKAKRCNKCSSRGSLNAMWKGGVSSLYQLAANKLWPAWKLPVLARDNYTCQKCNERKHLEVHHIRTFVSIREGIMKAHPELSLSNYDDKEKLVDLIVADHKLEDGTTLCYSCHKAYHAEKRDELRGYPNTSGVDNPQPSSRNVIPFVREKVQRLTVEDTQTNKTDTSVPLAKSLMAR